ncbi:MAG: carboxymuconolactone decarboxylase family protein [Pirellulales bacterium]
MHSQPFSATVALVEEATATGKVAEIFADIRKTKGIEKVPAFWRTLATAPDQLELIWTRLKSLMHPEAVGRKSNLDARTREIIAVAVSATNGCSYCVQSTRPHSKNKVSTTRRWVKSWESLPCLTPPTHWRRGIKSHPTFSRPKSKIAIGLLRPTSWIGR